MPAPTDADRLAARARPPGHPVLLARSKEFLSLHWKWAPADIQRSLPPGLSVDVFQGHAWLGIVLAFLEAARPRLCPALPGLSEFAVLGVRTYVYDRQGRPGIWFYSLDTNRWLAAKLALVWYCLPCERADIAARSSRSGGIDCRIRRRGTGAESRFAFRANPGRRDLAEPEVGSIEFFLFERYRYFAYEPARGLFTAGVAHPPFRLGAAEMAKWDDAWVHLAGFDTDARRPDHVCGAGPSAMAYFRPEQVAEPEAILVPDPEAGDAGAVPA